MRIDTLLVLVIAVCGSLLYSPPATAQGPGPAPGTKPATKPAVATLKRLVQADVSVKPGELIVIPSNSSGEVAWLYDARDFDARHAYQRADELVLTTTRPGTYSVNMIAWDEKKVQQVLITVEGDVPPAPTPGPGPVPTPPGPGPVPVPSPLDPAATAAVAKLAGFKTQAAALADFYASFQQALERSPILAPTNPAATTEQFRNAYSNALTNFVATAEYKGAPAISADVNAYLAARLGPPTVTKYTAEFKAKAIKAFADLEAALRELAR